MLNALLIWLGKSLSWGLRRVGKHGAALPGLVVERIKPSFLSDMLTQLPQGVVIISGTNGKTTTTKLVSEVLRAQGKRVLTNRTGSNFVRGIVSSIIQAADARGKLHYDIAIIELDEAYAVKFTELVAPRVTLVLNVMRDQLDRFGEIDTTARLLQTVADRTTEMVVLNDDDNRTRNFTTASGAETRYFGVDAALAHEFPNDEELYGRPKPVVKNHGRAIELVRLEGETATYRTRAGELRTDLKIDGPHNALNAAAALSLLEYLLPHVSLERLARDLGQVNPAFGRGEILLVGGRRVILQLVKNPAGFRQSLHVLDIHKPGAIVIAINDNYADGRDVSWLWDIDFQTLKAFGRHVITGGTRGYDMALRLKYDDVAVSRVETEISALANEIKRQTNDGKDVLLFTTYTAMLKLRKLLGKKTEMADA